MGQPQLRKLLEAFGIEIVRQSDQHTLHEPRLLRGEYQVHAAAEVLPQHVIPAQQLRDADACSRRLHLRLIHPFGYKLPMGVVKAQISAVVEAAEVACPGRAAQRPRKRQGVASAPRRRHLLLRLRQQAQRDLHAFPAQRESAVLEADGLRFHGKAGPVAVNGDRGAESAAQCDFAAFRVFLLREGQQGRDVALVGPLEVAVGCSDQQERAQRLSGGQPQQADDDDRGKH